MPFSEMRSPIHMTSVVPAVRTMPMTPNCIQAGMFMGISTSEAEPRLMMMPIDSISAMAMAV